jgi:hypothetical protein
MHRSFRRLALAALLLSTSACVAHDRAGDKAAAVGDWKTAYLEYRQAVSDEPGDTALRRRFAEARERALAQSTGQARACAAQQRWDCVLSEADFALAIDGTDVELARLRATAARAAALARVQGAEEALARGDLRGAQGQLVEARRLSTDPAVAEAARPVERRWVAAAMAEAGQLQRARRYPEAIALAQAAAGLDASARPELERLTAEFETWRDAEHDRLAAEGEAALGRKAWADAAARLRAAQAMRPDQRARALEQYADLVGGGDEAVERGDWRSATRAYEEAVRLGVERTGYAATQLDRVMVRPRAIRIRSVLIEPLRPDGTPWVGPPGRRLEHLSRELTQEMYRLPPGRVTSGMLLLLERIPRENRPTQQLVVTLPDGRRLATPPRREIYATLDAVVVVLANQLDRRHLLVEVVHGDPGGAQERIGGVDIAMGELVTRGNVALAGPPVLGLELSAEPAGGLPEGSAAGLLPLAPPGAPPRRPPPPGQ